MPSEKTGGRSVYYRIVSGRAAVRIFPLEETKMPEKRSLMQVAARNNMLRRRPHIYGRITAAVGDVDSACHFVLNTLEPEGAYFRRRSEACPGEYQQSTRCPLAPQLSVDHSRCDVHACITVRVPRLAHDVSCHILL